MPRDDLVRKQVERLGVGFLNGWEVGICKANCKAASASELGLTWWYLNYMGDGMFLIVAGSYLDGIKRR